MTPSALEFFSNSAAGTSEAKTFPGGKAAFVCKATWGGGNIKLQMMGADGATYFDVASSTISADGMLVFDLPPGTFKAVATTSTANYAKLVTIPS